MSTPVDHVLGLMTARHPEKIRFPGAELEAMLGQWGASSLDLLIHLALPERRQGWLLMQGGRVVYAHHAHWAAGQALGALRDLASQAVGHAHLLRPPALALLLAAVDGTAVAFRQALRPEDRFLLPALRERSFGGVLLLESPTDLHLWVEPAAGQPGPPWPPPPGDYRKSLFAWTPRALPELRPAEPGLHEPRLDEPSPEPEEARAHPSTDLIWQMLERELTYELDERAPRVLALLRKEHGRDDAPSLMHHLLGHLERVIGPDAAHQFRSQLLKAWMN